MPRIRLNLIYLLTFLSILLIPLVLFLLNTSFVRSATDHIVISEVQVRGTAADDEFIELYNPTSTAVDISSWSIQRETTGEGFERKNFVSGDSIPSNGFFLIAHSAYTTIPVTPDMTHSSFSLSDTGTTVFLVNNQVDLTTGDETTIVDKVAIGESALDAENSPFPTIPTDGESIERKALSTSDSTSIGSGGTDEFLGNGEDTDDNSSDFVTRSVSEPQNSESAIETPPTPSPTETPTPTPTESPEPTETASPTPEPTETASPTPESTETPTPEPTESPSPEPTETPTPTPSESPEPTESPLPTESPTPTETPTPTPSPVLKTMTIGFFPLSNTVCKLELRAFRRGFMFLILPSISCSRM